MSFHTWISRWATLPILLCPSLLGVAAENWHRHDPDLWHFATRPDLKPPKWEVKVYDSEKLSDGYWFIGPKGGLETFLGKGESWFGPAIFDGNGELVWSGSAQLDTPNIMEFRQSYVEGKERLTMLDRDRHTGTIIDNDYEIHRVLKVGSEDQVPDDSINGHELNFIEGGKTVLFVKNNKRDAPQADKEATGFDGDGECKANFNGFNEMDVATGKPVFEWSSYDRIHLQECTIPYKKVNAKCNTFDFIHTNSVDKLPDGDYVLSGRHTDTIFKISHKDGSIVWRLGGKTSDFELGPGVKFSCQHNIRARGQNETHTLVSLLDNAKGEDGQVPSHDFSRGLLIALRTDVEPMTASLVAHYDHPRGGYAQRRGNMQIMDNGNVFMGWSERALHSEHSPDGTLLMEAIFQPDWMGTYRAYKFPYVGRPTTKPDVISVAYMLDEEKKDNPTTKVFVSWNGDTEVRNWRLSGGSKENSLSEIETKDRKGFETQFDHDGYYKYVSLEGLDKNNKVITSTGAIKTEPHPSAPYGFERTESGEATYVVCSKSDKHSVEDPVFIFLLSFTCAAGAFLLTWFGILPIVRHKKSPWIAKALRPRGGTLEREGQYKMVNADDFDLEDDDGESDQKLPLSGNDSSSHLTRSSSPS